MRILLVQLSDSGHRLNYINALAKLRGCETLAIVNRVNESTECRQIVYSASDFHNSRSVKAYLDWIKEVGRTAKKENCDVVHILDGDQIYRYFGLGLNSIGVPVVITYHHMSFEKLKEISVKRIFSKTAAGVVHTDSLKNDLLERGINNVTKIEYPFFNEESSLDKKAAKEKYGIPSDRMCLSFVGSISSYKGLNYLLDALNLVKNPFVLNIAGKPVSSTEEEIKAAVSNYKDSALLNIYALDGEEYIERLTAADCLVLPYKREFDGASGIMIDAAWCRTPVIAAGHGSMADIVTRYKLGVTFETENTESLAKVIDSVLKNGLEWGEKAEDFRNLLTVESFCNSYYGLYESLVK